MHRPDLGSGLLAMLGTGVWVIIVFTESALGREDLLRQRGSSGVCSSHGFSVAVCGSLIRRLEVLQIPARGLGGGGAEGISSHFGSHMAT